MSWGDWSGDWSDWSDWATDWGGDWGADYAYMSLLTGAERRMLYSPYTPPKQQPYEGKGGGGWLDLSFDFDWLTKPLESIGTTARDVFGDVGKILGGFAAAGVASGIKLVSGFSEGKEYHEKSKQLKEQEREIEKLIEKGEKEGKITWEGNKMVVSDKKLYEELQSMTKAYEQTYKEVKKLETEITPKFSAKDYPIIGEPLYKAEKSAISWLETSTKPLGPAGEFISGVGSGIVGIVELPAFVANLAVKPQSVTGSMTVQALESPVKFTGSIVGGIIGGKLTSAGVGRVFGSVGRALTTAKPIKQTVIVGDEIIYRGKPLSKPIVTESLKIESIKPVSARVEKTAAEYQGFKVDVAEVESGIERTYEITPLKVTKTETIEPMWKITLKEPAEIKTVIEYQSKIGKLTGKRHVVTSELKGDEAAVTLYKGVKVKGTPKTPEGGIISAESVKRIKSKVLEEFEMPESDTAVPLPSKPKQKPKVEIRPRTPFKLEKTIKESVEKAKEKVEKAKEAKEAKTTQVLETKKERVIYSPVSLVIPKAIEEAEVYQPLRFPMSPPLPPSLSITPIEFSPFPRIDFKPKIFAPVVVKPEVKPAVMPTIKPKPAIEPMETPIKIEKPLNIEKPIEKPKIANRSPPIEKSKPTTVEKPIVSVPPTITPSTIVTVPTVSLPIPYFPPILLPPLPKQSETERTYRQFFEEKSKKWWTGLTASYNILTAFELRTGKKGMHLLAKEAYPFWERFLSSPGFVGIPTAQQILKSLKKSNKEKKEKKEKKKKKKGKKKRGGR